MIKFFYDYFDPEQICGMYTPGHFLMIAFFIVTSILILRVTVRLSVEKVRRINLWIAIVFTAVEMLKISLRVYKGHNPSEWVPLYFCSLFLYAVWFSYSKNSFLKNIGCSYIAMGGLIAAVTFCLYPSTSLAIYPVWHPESIHSYIYHIVLFCSGITILATGYYKPKAKDSIHYFIFLSLAAIPSVILNVLIGTNCLFLADAYGLAFLPEIIAFSPVLYAVLAFLTQASALFWVSYGVYKLVVWLKQRAKKELPVQVLTEETTEESIDEATEETVAV